MATETELTPISGLYPLFTTSSSYTTGTKSPKTPSPAATPASSRPPSICSRPGPVPPNPPNSVDGCPPYGALSRGIDHLDLKHLPSDYESIFKDPTPTPATRSAKASPLSSPQSLPADKLEVALASVPELLEPLPTPLYYTPSRFSVGSPKSDVGSACESGDVLFINSHREPRPRPIPTDTLHPQQRVLEFIDTISTCEPYRPVANPVEFITANGVFEYSTWTMDVKDQMEAMLRRCKQMAIDLNKQHPRYTVEEYYNAFLYQQLNNPDLGIRFTPHADRKPDMTPDEIKAMEAKIEELASTVSKLTSENAAMKQEMEEIKQMNNKVQEMKKDTQHG